MMPDTGSRTRSLGMEWEEGVIKEEAGVMESKEGEGGLGRYTGRNSQRRIGWCQRGRNLYLGGEIRREL